MRDYRFQTPDGLSDILPEDCAAKREMENRLRKLFGLYGYQEIETPGLEFLDVFSGADFVMPEHMYKMTDESGRLLALRYDGTIPAARVAATLLREEPLPLRLSYVENMYRFKESGGGRQKEFSQGGVELLGVSSPEADAEVIALAIRSALDVGVEDLQISLGQVEFFLGLMEEWQISAENAQAFSRLIDQKDTVALGNLADRCSLGEHEKELLLLLPARFGTYDILDDFENRIRNKKAEKALRNIRDILDILDDYGYLQYVSVDFGMLRSLDYYTGMIFKGFTYEIGFPVFSGGRYDHVVSAFGKDIPSVGFSIGINLCMTALQRQKKALIAPAIDVVLGYASPAVRAKALKKAENLRGEGLRTLLDCEGKTKNELENFAEKAGIHQCIYIEEST